MASKWNGVRAAGKAIAVLGLLAGGSASAQVFKAVNFAKHPAPTVIAAQGAEVTLRPIKDGDLVKGSATIKIAGFAPLTVVEDTPADATYDRWVGIGKLAASDAAPTIFLQGFTGGAHCCATLTVVTPYQGALKPLTLEAIDGGGSETFPTDVNKDGVIDIQRQDDIFRYQFASGAGSYSPAIFYNVRDGKLVDVSDEPSFAPYWEDFAKESRALCADQTSEERNAACAVYVVAGKHLGRFEATMADAVTLANNDATAIMPAACTVAAGDDGCPEGKERKFANFEEALRWVLEFGKSSN